MSLKRINNLYSKLSGLEKLKFMRQNGLQQWPAQADRKTKTDSSHHLSEQEGKRQQTDKSRSSERSEPKKHIQRRVVQ